MNHSSPGVILSNCIEQMKSIQSVDSFWCHRFWFSKTPNKVDDVRTDGFYIYESNSIRSSLSDWVCPCFSGNFGELHVEKCLLSLSKTHWSSKWNWVWEASSRVLGEPGTAYGGAEVQKVTKLRSYETLRLLFRVTQCYGSGSQVTWQVEVATLF